MTAFEKEDDHDHEKDGNWKKKELVKSMGGLTRTMQIMRSVCTCVLCALCVRFTGSTSL